MARFRKITLATPFIPGAIAGMATITVSPFRCPLRLMPA